MKVTLSLLAAALLVAGLAGCATSDAPISDINTTPELSQKPHLLPEQVVRVARERASDQKVVLSDFNMGGHSSNAERAN